AQAAPSPVSCPTPLINARFPRKFHHESRTLVASSRVRLCGAALCDLFGRLVEEESLSNGRLDRFWQERFRHEIGRLWSLSRQKLFRIGRYEDDWNVEAVENFRDRINTRPTFAQIDVGKDEAWSFRQCLFDRLLPGRCNRDHGVA